jgi:23S rRNA pseudouridine1911/1915/1917 synthase
MKDLNVLYEDNHLIAVEKPAGMLVQADDTRDKCLMDYVKEYLKEKYQKPGNVFLGLIHRLDRPVGGVVLFAKTSKGASRVSEQFRNHTIQKIYHAVVEGIPKVKSQTLVHYIEKVGENSFIARVSDTPNATSVKAELSYEVLDTKDNKALVKVLLKTGKFHQIRAQLAHIGHPIVGDIKYGAKGKLLDQTILLKATTLTFTTATGDEQKTVSVDLPSL